jgi:hypothetical protein
MIIPFIKSRIQKNKNLILNEVVEVKGFMYILMKPRNTGEKWTKEEKKEIKRHLKRISKMFTILLIFLLPGGGLLLPILAEVLDRRRSRRVAVKPTSEKG